MTLDDLKAYAAGHLDKAEDDMKAKINEVISYFRSEEIKDAAKVEAEVADLRARGWTVTEPIELVTVA